MKKFTWTKDDLLKARTDRTVMDALVTENMPFIYKQCWEFSRLQFRFTDMRELIGIAVETFMKCIRKAKVYRTKNEFLEYCRIAIKRQLIYDMVTHERDDEVEYIEEREDSDFHKPYGIDSYSYCSMFKDDEVIDHMINDEQEKHNITRYLSCLDERERFIITNVLGLNDDKQTLEKIGKELHLTSERIRQIKLDALQKMRNHIKTMKRKGEL